ncbi:uncharacterized protein LOC124267315 [Haliotis rubra]|uniref:uncharacterized protein LOC124267315 n=1 Tax=Haliotis rubra TaxID=36100 RepID=UPI001EE53498|nr:uncharacterized protein LOC124267315 [Haliotis rubra]
MFTGQGTCFGPAEEHGLHGCQPNEPASVVRLQTAKHGGTCLNMSHTVNLTVEQNGDMHNLEVNEDVAKLLVSADTDAEVKQIIIDQLCRSQCDKTNQTNTEAVAKCSVDNPEVGDIMWTKPAEKLILDEHKKMEEEKKPSKNKWKRMSQIMCDNKYNFTAEQCRLKIKSLKDRYAKQKKK